MAVRVGLVVEVVAMAFDTLRTNKLRSALTVLGVVIGITSIVGMTSLVRGFDESLRELIEEAGPNIIYVERFGVTSFANGFELKEFLKRPNLTVSDARALETQTSTLQYVDVELGAAPVGPVTQRRVYYRNLKSKTIVVVGAEHFEVVGVFDKRPAPGGANLSQDDFVVVPYTTYQRVFGLLVGRVARTGTVTNIMISALPREGVSREAALADVERVMRIRHGLKLDEPDDFDLSTQDTFMKLWDRISQATFL